VSTRFSPIPDIYTMIFDFILSLMTIKLIKTSNGLGSPSKLRTLIFKDGLIYVIIVSAFAAIVREEQRGNRFRNMKLSSKNVNIRVSMVSVKKLSEWELQETTSGHSKTCITREVLPLDSDPRRH